MADADVFVLSKGHAAPILWAALKEAGAIRDDLMGLRRFDSPLEGHPTPHCPWVRVATGSLGQGLSAAAGMAWARELDGTPARVYTLLGDGEAAEGSVWEAAQFASFNRLDNMCAVVDVNRLGQSGPTMYQHDTAPYEARFRAFGWEVAVVDGHDVAALRQAFSRARSTAGRPFAIVARTLKGKGVSFLEDQDGWHGKPVRKGEELQRAVAELGDTSVMIAVDARHYPPAGPKAAGDLTLKPDYALGQEVATREAYGRPWPSWPWLPAPWWPSTATRRTPPSARSSSRRRHSSSPRAISPSRTWSGRSHAGVSIGEDGPSQMALEDLAMMRALTGSTVLYPSDAVSAERIVEAAARTPGIVYIRTTRPKTPVLYANEEYFPVGQSKTLRASARDAVTVVAAGITLHEALKAHEVLAREGIAIRVIDLYSVKPVDAETLRKAAVETKGLVTVEDHSLCGGLGEAVLAAVRSRAPVAMLGVTAIPRSGNPAELMRHRRRIDAEAIVETVKTLA